METVFEVVAVLEKTPITPEILEVIELSFILEEYCHRTSTNEYPGISSIFVSCLRMLSGFVSCNRSPCSVSLMVEFISIIIEKRISSSATS